MCLVCRHAIAVPMYICKCGQCVFACCLLFFILSLLFGSAFVFCICLKACVFQLLRYCVLLFWYMPCSLKCILCFHACLYSGASCVCTLRLILPKCSHSGVHLYVASACVFCVCFVFLRLVVDCRMLLVCVGACACCTCKLYVLLVSLCCIL